MANLPKSGNRTQQGKINKDLLIGVLFVIFVVASIGGMLLIDYFGEAKMGNTQQPADAAEQR